MNLNDVIDQRDEAPCQAMPIWLVRATAAAGPTSGLAERWTTVGDLATPDLPTSARQPTLAQPRKGQAA